MFAKLAFLTAAAQLPPTNTCRDYAASLTKQLDARLAKEAAE